MTYVGKAQDKLKWAMCLRGGNNWIGNSSFLWPIYHMPYDLISVSKTEAWILPKGIPWKRDRPWNFPIWAPRTSLERSWNLPESPENLLQALGIFGTSLITLKLSEILQKNPLGSITNLPDLSEFFMFLRSHVGSHFTNIWKTQTIISRVCKVCNSFVLRKIQGRFRSSENARDIPWKCYECKRGGRLQTIY